MPIVAAAASEGPNPASAESLSCSIDEIVGLSRGRPSNATVVLRGGSGGVARLGLALEPWPGLAAWMERERLDGLFLHREWGLDTAALPPTVAVVANHDGFDRRFAFGNSPELLAGLGLRPLSPLASRDGYPLGVVAQGPARAADALRAALEATFGGFEEELATPRRSPISRIALARAMTADLVREAAGWGAQAYVTGQLRQSARGAAAQCGLHLFAVGHRRSEAWALARLAGELGVRWPGLTTCIPSDPRPAASRADA